MRLKEEIRKIVVWIHFPKNKRCVSQIVLFPIDNHPLYMQLPPWNTDESGHHTLKFSSVKSQFHRKSSVRIFLSQQSRWLCQHDMKGRHRAGAVIDRQGFTSSKPIMISATLTPYLRQSMVGGGEYQNKRRIREHLQEKEQTPSLGITQGNNRELQHINRGYINTLIKARV